MGLKGSPLRIALKTLYERMEQSLSLKKSNYPQDLLEAQEEFKKFLNSRRFNQNIEWICNTNIIFRNKIIYYKTDKHLFNYLNELYVNNFHKNGAELFGLAYDDNYILTQLILPESENDAEASMISNQSIKLYINQNSFEIIKITSFIVWYFLKIMNLNYYRKIKKNLSK